LIDMDLEMIIIGNVMATIVAEGSVEVTKEILHAALDFAFLDVDVTNGQTFEIAHILERERVPFVFMSDRRKISCHFSCAAHRSFPSLFTRLKLSACCRLSQTNPSLPWLILISREVASTGRRSALGTAGNPSAFDAKPRRGKVDARFERRTGAVPGVLLFHQSKWELGSEKLNVLLNHIANGKHKSG